MNFTNALDCASLAFRCFAVLVGVLLVPDAYAKQAADLCIVPVKNGEPTSADLFAIYRMVSEVDVIPQLKNIYIQPFNRGGRWTVDQTGTYRPFEGAFPTRGLHGIDHQWASDRSGRVVGANRKDIFVLQPPDTDFHHLLNLENVGAGGMPTLKYESHTEKIYVATSKSLFELNGKSLIQSPLAVEAQEKGMGRIFVPHYLPSIQAHLIESTTGKFAIRYEDGAWQILDAPQCGRGCRTYPTEVFDLEKESSVVVKLAYGFFIVDLSSPRHPRTQLIYTTRGNMPRMYQRFSSETDTYLFYDADLFRTLVSKSASLTFSDSWLLRVTGAGVSPVPGDKVHPIQTTWASGPRDFTPPFVDLPGWKKTLLRGQDGLALFDGTSVRTIENSGPDRIGTHPQITPLPSIGRVFVLSENGLFYLNPDGLIPIDTPFQIHDIIPRAIDVPEMNVAVVISNAGVFSVNESLAFHRISGGDSVELGRLTKALATIPATGDVLIQAENALFLLKKFGCHD